MKDHVIEFTVIVPFLNAASTLGDLLQSLAAQTLPPHELLLIDNGSTDKSCQVISDFLGRNPGFPARVRDEAVRGPGAARNRGILEATCQFIAFFDADCIPDRCWLEAAGRVLRETSADAVGGVVRPARTTGTIAEATATLLLGPQALPGVPYRWLDEADVAQAALQTNNVAVRREALRLIDGFNATAFSSGGEDLDLFIRLKRRGARLIGRHHQLVIQHQDRSTLNELTRQVLSYSQNFVRIVATHFLSRIILVGRVQLISRHAPATVWIFCNYTLGTFAIILAALFWDPLRLLPPILIVVFALSVLATVRRCARANISLTAKELVAVTLGILYCKLLWQFGLLLGSVRYRVVVV